MKRTPLLFAALVTTLLLGACGSDSATDSSSGSSTSVPAPTEHMLDDLTVEYGCGFGFYLGNSDQTAGLFVSTNQADVPDVSDLVADGAWFSEVQIGEDLFANWCDDVIEVGEPEPLVTERWSLVSGTISISSRPESDCGPASAKLVDVTVERLDGTQIEIDDVDVDNAGWGCFAG